MEKEVDINTKKHIKEKYSMDVVQKKNLDSIKIRTEKYKSLGKKKPKTLLNFISGKKKIQFKSNFDKKGAKKFLNEKSKAMEEIVLIDYIEEEKNRDISKNHTKKNKSHNKNSHKNKNIKQHRSQNALIHLEFHKLSNKNNNLLQEKNKKNNLSSKTLSVNFINNIKDIGKININNNKKKVSIISLQSNDSRENDSFIYTIVNQIGESKNKF